MSTRQVHHESRLTFLIVWPAARFVLNFQQCNAVQRSATPLWSLRQFHNIDPFAQSPQAQTAVYAVRSIENNQFHRRNSDPPHLFDDWFLIEPL